MKLSLVFLCIYLVGCSASWHGPAIAITPTGTRLCAKHQVALITVQGYKHLFYPDLPPEHPYDASDKVEARCPNAIPLNERLSPPGDPVPVTYCPVCEREAQRIYRFQPHPFRRDRPIAPLPPARSYRILEVSASPNTTL